MNGKHVGVQIRTRTTTFHCIAKASGPEFVIGADNSADPNLISTTLFDWEQTSSSPYTLLIRLKVLRSGCSTKTLRTARRTITENYKKRKRKQKHTFKSKKIEQERREEVLVCRSRHDGRKFYKTVKCKPKGFKRQRRVRPHLLWKDKIVEIIVRCLLLLERKY